MVTFTLVRWSSPSILKEKENKYSTISPPFPEKHKILALLPIACSAILIGCYKLLFLTLFCDHFWHGLMARAENMGIFFFPSWNELNLVFEVLVKKSNKFSLLFVKNSMNHDHQLANCVRDVFFCQPLKFECAFGLDIFKTEIEIHTYIYIHIHTYILCVYTYTLYINKLVIFFFQIIFFLLKFLTKILGNFRNYYFWFFYVNLSITKWGEKKP